MIPINISYVVLNVKAGIGTSPKFSSLHFFSRLAKPIDCLRSSMACPIGLERFMSVLAYAKGNQTPIGCSALNLSDTLEISKPLYKLSPSPT